MKRLILLPFFSLMIMALAPSCKHNPYLPDDLTDDPNDTIDNSQPCSQDTVYFENQIQPILISNCAKPGCHDANTREEGYNFADYNDFINTDAFDGGNLGNSEVWDVINENDPDKIMPEPPNAPLTQDQKNLIRTWILQGAKNNGCTDSNCDTTNLSLASDIRPIFQASCMGCHSSAAANASGAGINLETYPTLQTYAGNGLLLCAVIHGSGCTPMPFGGAKLPACQVDKIVSWINAGALNN